MSAIIDYRGKTPQKTTFGVPLITAKIVKGGRILPAEEFIAESDYEAWMRRGMPLPGDVVVTTEAPLGEVAQLDDRKIALAQRLIGLRGRPDRLDNTFLRFAMQAAIVQDQLASRASGTTVLGIRQAELRHVEIPLPPLPEQRAIARVLGGLDDKIELNRRMNRTLEDLARGLFRSWFVDFDPVTKNGSAKPPAAPHDLFPIRLVDSPASSSFGPIPDGWSVGCLGDWCDVNAHPIRDRPSVGDFHYIDISSVSRGNLDGPRSLPWKDAPSRAQRLVAHGDTLWSCVRPNLEAYLLLHHPASDWVASTGFAVLSPRSGARSFVYLATTQPDFIDYLTARAEGSAYPAVRPDAFTGAPLVHPPEPVVKKFESIVGPWLDRCGENREEAKKLAALRDALLPQLLSGEIRLREAERATDDSIRTGRNLVPAAKGGV
jgi:type I restriction enzyme S subunit